MTDEVPFIPPPDPWWHHFLRWKLGNYNVNSTKTVPTLIRWLKKQGNKNG